MPLIKALRLVLILTVLTMLIQATFAGRIIGGDARAVRLHENTARILVLLACAQMLLTIVMSIKAHCPLWIPLVSGALLAAEIIEFAAGHFHNLYLHVPLGVAIFGGPVRLLLWTMQDGARLAPRSDWATFADQTQPPFRS